MFLKECPRCQRSHENLKVKQFTNAVLKDYTHWAICPILSEPILLGSYVGLIPQKLLEEMHKEEDEKVFNDLKRQMDL